VTVGCGAADVAVWRSPEADARLEAVSSFGRTIVCHRIRITGCAPSRPVRRCSVARHGQCARAFLRRRGVRHDTFRACVARVSRFGPRLALLPPGIRYGRERCARGPVPMGTVGPACLEESDADAVLAGSLSGRRRDYGFDGAATATASGPWCHAAGARPTTISDRRCRDAAGRN